MAPRGMTPARMTDMKKTLITLAALSMVSVASAANGVADDWATDYEISSGRYWAPGCTDYGTTANSYTWIAVLDWDTAVSNLGIWSDKSRIYATDNRNTTAALGFSLFKNNDGDIQFMFSEHNGKDLWVDTASNYATTQFKKTDGSSTVLTETNYANQGKLVLSFSYDDTNKIYTMGALTASGDVHTLTVQKESTWDVLAYNGIDLKNHTTSIVESLAWYDNTALTGTSLQYAMQTAIPEPATATLSLLALAGLAARRRRK